MKKEEQEEKVEGKRKQKVRGEGLMGSCEQENDEAGGRRVREWGRAKKEKGKGKKKRKDGKEKGEER